MDLRAFTLNISLDEVHKNRDLPSAFVCWLGVLDITLPSRGTAHRAVRGGSAEIDSAAGVNVCLVPHSLRVFKLVLVLGQWWGDKAFDFKFGTCPRSSKVLWESFVAEAVPAYRHVPASTE